MKTSRTLLALAMMFILSGVTDSNQRTATLSAEQVQTASAHPLHAARLRKLHLVRPDLINYPLSFEVVC